ncbi:MAG: response regulator [Lachnospiraceae bacterium]|nr:response regulator [Lachnospiraceae bacterium]
MYTIIIADDEAELRQALIRRIDWKEVGFQVVGEAENGAEALELVEKLEPDLLLTDVRMPFMSGIELARAVREIRPNIQIAFLSGFDDFTYAQQAIQYNIISYLLKPISSKELTEELKKIKKKIDDKFEEFTRKNAEQEQQSLVAFFMPLLLDSFSDVRGPEREKALSEEAARRGFVKPENRYMNYTVLVTSFRDKEGKNQTLESGVNAINTILRKYVRHVSFYTDGRIVSLLAGTRQSQEKYLHILVEDISQSVKRIMNLTATIGVSRMVPGLGHCHEAYLEAMDAFGYARRSDTGVSFISDIERTAIFDQETIQAAVNEIESLLRSGTESELKAYLTQLFAKLEQEDKPAMNLQLVMVQLVAAVFRVVYAVADSEAVENLQKTSPLLGQFFFENPREMEERYIAFCLTARELAAEHRKKSGSVICDRALAIMENRFMDPELSLNAISTEISVSPNYLSTLIKRSTGSTFIDLLTRKRMKTAKKLLLDTPMKIREISEKCGYNDQHYFSYCFKKYEGISPNACRRKFESELPELSE